MGEFEAIKVMAAAMDELRGLDRSLIIELEENAGDIVGCCALIETVLTGFLRLPRDAQTSVLIAGVAPNKTAAAYALADQKLNKTLKDLDEAWKNYRASEAAPDGEVDCIHWLTAVDPA